MGARINSQLARSVDVSSAYTTVLAVGPDSIQPVILPGLVRLVVLFLDCNSIWYSDEDSSWSSVIPA